MITAGSSSPKVAIIDYGMGNLFSVLRVCEHVGLKAFLASSPDALTQANIVILPGVGAFADAMAALNGSGLSAALRDWAALDKPLIGICLGMQLLMTESEEFGRHEGLNLIAGRVRRLAPAPALDRVKIPQVSWNQIWKASEPWSGSLLEGLTDGEFMYFIHSFYVQPQDQAVVLSTSEYGGNVFCSSLQAKNIFGFQFHPEKSGQEGLKIYSNLARILRRDQQVQTL